MQQGSVWKVFGKKRKLYTGACEVIENMEEKVEKKQSAIIFGLNT